MTEDKYTRLPIDYVIKSVAIITREDLRKCNYVINRDIHYIVWAVYGGDGAYIEGRVQEPWRRLRRAWRETTL